jgi:hypothetical protein
MYSHVFNHSLSYSPDCSKTAVGSPISPAEEGSSSVAKGRGGVGGVVWCGVRVKVRFG